MCPRFDAEAPVACLDSRKQMHCGLLTTDLTHCMFPKFGLEAPVGSYLLR